MEDDLQKKTHDATLAYLTKPSYQSSIFVTQNKNTKEPITVSKDDKRFYKKRILSVTKEMFYKNSYPKTLQKMHTDYIANIIEYLKVCDMEDIVQSEYDDIELNIGDHSTGDHATGDHVTGDHATKNSDKTPHTNDSADINKPLYNVKPPRNPLESFVTTKKINVKPVHIPKQKKIDLKNPLLKTKGIKKKKK